MLREGNGNGPYHGVDERERLRRRARKLGLRLLKSDRCRSHEERELTQSAIQPGGNSDKEARELLNPFANLDKKCG